MVLVSMVVKRWNELCISRYRRYRTGEKIHILEECTMAPVKLLAYHLYVRRISFYNNPTPYKKKKKKKRKTLRHSHCTKQKMNKLFLLIETNTYYICKDQLIIHYSHAKPGKQLFKPTSDLRNDRHFDCI
jgi:hypothetical protein